MPFFKVRREGEAATWFSMDAVAPDALSAAQVWVEQHPGRMALCHHLGHLIVLVRPVHAVEEQRIRVTGDLVATFEEG